MYRFLDRALWEIDEPYRFLVASVRLWVQRVRAGQCPCVALAPGFTYLHVEGALRDFTVAMAVLDRNALTTLRFGQRGALAVLEDEARILALFEAALSGECDRVRRIAATLVTDGAVASLTTAVGWVALHLAQGVIEERDR
jgi:hypothetical protein